MISVETALQSRFETSGFMYQNAYDMAKDDVMFSGGVNEVRQLANALQGADPFTWRASIQKIVDGTHQDYPIDTAMLAAHHFPTTSMLWLFETPIMTVMGKPDVTGKREARNYTIDGVWIVAWKKIKESETPSISFVENDRAVHATATGVRVFALHKLQGYRSVPLPRGLISGPRPVFYLPVVFTSLIFGQTNVRSAVSLHSNDATFEEEETYLRKWVLAGTALLNQRILIPEEQPIVRHERKRLEKAHVPIGEVKVITLRASTSTSKAQGDNHVDWSHRWTVRGHWRNQWYPSQEEHRIVFIPSYIKGPSDKPLVVSPSVFNVCR